MEFPLEDRDKCFKLNYPKCLGVRTKCPTLHYCHNEYSGVLETGLLRTVDDSFSLWTKTFIAFVISIPIIYIILLFFRGVN